MNHRHILSLAIGSLLVLGGVSGTAQAADSKNMEKCFGIAKAGKNDCSSSISAHACVGQGVKDGDTMDFLAVP
ncbi:MAG: DUF2282 domain-containing protein, partial [Pseudomonadota bacterium]|nr:DUF2282 domain-containing protein [Pseudomonadota bacterium]